MKPDPSRVEAVFLAAIDIAEAPRRAAFLDESCGGDVALRRRVECLLAADEKPGPFLEPTTIPLGMKAAVAMLAPEAAGERVGNYKLLEQIGEGGFGTVWMAEQEQPVRRRVALKIIKLGMDTKEVIARFEQERQALAMMDHPNIARVFDAGATPFGRPYFVMELVRGVKITDYCDEAGLPTADRLQLFIPVCQAVQHAHQKGIIHRDLKPSNILVTLHDGVPVPKVIDFGVAKAIEARLTERTLLTQFQQMIGTPLYMSPEQAEMSGLDIDTRSDIYSLGVLLYELLTGRTPIDGETMRSVGLDEMRRLIREVDPPRPSTEAQRRGRQKRQGPDVAHSSFGRWHRPRPFPSDLDWIVMKALEKDRTRRYDTANAFALDIQRFLRDEPVSAAPPSAGYQFRKFARRHKAALRVGAAFTGLLLASAVLSTWQAVRATRAETLATARAKAEEEQRQRAEASETHARAAEKEAIARAQSEVAQRQLAEASETRARAAEKDASDKAAEEKVARKEAEDVTGFLTSVFGSAKANHDGRTVTVAETLAAAAGKLDAEMGTQPARRAKLQSILADTYRSLGLLREAIALQEKARDYYVATLGPERRETLNAMTDLAATYSATGRLDEALQLREQVLTLRRKANGPDHPDTLKAMADVATSFNAGGRLSDELKLREQVLELRRKVLGPEHPDTLGAMRALALSYVHAARRDEALTLREQALELSRKALGPEHPDTLGAMRFLASSYFDLGRRDEALALREQVFELERRIPGTASAYMYDAMCDLATSYADAGRDDEEFTLRKQALDLQIKRLGPEHRDTLQAMTMLSDFHRRRGDLEKAIDLQEKALAIERRVLDAGHPYLTVAISNLAGCYDAVGRTDEAKQLRKDLAALRKKPPK